MILRFSYHMAICTESGFTMVVRMYDECFCTYFYVKFTVYRGREHSCKKDNPSYIHTMIMTIYANMKEGKKN